MTSNRWCLAIAAALSAALLLGGCTSNAGSSGSGTALGEAIFTSGQGHAGPIPRSMTGGPSETKGLSCAGCHGAQGQGTGIGPSITRATLGTQHTITHKPSPSDQQPRPVTEGPWTSKQTVEVVRTGTTPEGAHLGGRMPQWQLDSQDAAALAAYLDTLK